MTALTDSEEEELSDSEQEDQEPPEDELYILLQRIDRLHQGTDSDKRESLHILLERREQVRHTLTLLLLWSSWGPNTQVSPYFHAFTSVWAELGVSLAANASLQ